MGKYWDDDLDLNEGYIKPIEQLDEICRHLQGYSVSIHRWGDPDPEYAYLEPDEASIEVQNPYKETPLWIELGGECTMGFGNYHEHYIGDDESEFEYLLKHLDDLLQNRICTATLYAGSGEEKKWMGGHLMRKDQLAHMEISKEFDHILKTPEFYDRVKANGGSAEFRFWNGKDDREIIIRPW